MYNTTLTLAFSRALRDDPDGIFSVFYGEEFNTQDAELITEGSTYQVATVSFTFPNFPGGREIVAIGIGKRTATYCENIRKVNIGEQLMFLVEDEEIYHCV